MDCWGKLSSNAQTPPQLTTLATAKLTCHSSPDEGVVSEELTSPLLHMAVEPAPPANARVAALSPRRFQELPCRSNPVPPAPSTIVKYQP